VAPLLKFTVLRLALFLLALVTMRWLGASPLLAVVLAAVVSMLLSYVLLRGPREELAGVIEQRVAGRLGRSDQPDGSDGAAAGGRTAGARARAQDTAIEDAAADAAHRDQASGARSSPQHVADQHSSDQHSSDQHTSDQHDSRQHGAADAEQ
jgi:hypothetical protein